MGGVGGRRAEPDTMSRTAAPALGWAIASLLLFIAWQMAPALATPGACVADPASELPVKLWVYGTFARPALLLGGQVDGVGWPWPGPLNNPDLLGTLMVGGLGPILGTCNAWNLLVAGLTLANGLSAMALARQWMGGAATATTGPLVAGFAVALMPFVWVHCVAGAIIDVANLWPYVLSLHQLRVAWERGDASVALRAGVLLALGFELCPYNLLIFSPLLPVLALWIAFVGPAAVGLPAAPPLRTALRLVGAAALGALLLGLPVVFWTQSLMEAEGSQMSRALVSASRHAWPFAQLHPDNERYVATLVEWVSPGPWGLRSRERVSLFHRAMTPGLSVCALAAVGCLRQSPWRGAARLWSGLGLFAVLLAGGPYLPLTEDIAPYTPINLAWLTAFWLIPGQSMLLEPFRFAAAAAVCFAVAAAIGAEALRVSRPRPSWFGLAVAVAVALDLRLLAPHVSPAPVSQPTVPAVYDHLNEVLPPGPIIELPFFHRGGHRFRREPFLHALHHGRPIPNGVAGFVPPFITENGLLRSLLMSEGHAGPHRVGGSTAKEREIGAEQLIAAGFVGVVVNPALYAEPQFARFVRAELAPFGAPVERDGLWIWKISAPTP